MHRYGKSSGTVRGYWLLATTAAGLLHACASSQQGPFDDSTETGNPPVIDVTKVALVVSSDEVRVTGEAGAVTPGGIDLEVETLSSGDTQTGPVDADGSFDIAVDGSPDDTYALRAVAPSSGDASAPVYVYRGGARVGSEDGGALTCEEQNALIDAQLSRLEGQADRSCTTNADCSFSPTVARCPYFGCGGFIVGSAGRADVDDAVASIDLALCTPFEATGCLDGWPQPSCLARGPLACVAGECRDCGQTSCPQDSCQACDAPLVEWHATGAGFGGDSYTLTDCSALSVAPADGSPGCQGELACIADLAQGQHHSVAEIQNLLAEPVVQDALARDALFGAITPGGFGFQITVGTQQITITDFDCNGGDGCEDTPDAVLSLRGLLEDIQTTDACSTTVAAACSLPFDAGQGPGTLNVYAYHPQSGACVPRVYTGVGGNENRFDDLASCQAACPSPFSAGSCPPDRTYVEDACLTCGIVGGCAESVSACAKLCTVAADCAGEWGTCGSRGFCEQAGCI